MDQGALHFLYHLEDSLKVVRLSPVALEADASFGACVIQVFLGALGQILSQRLQHEGPVRGRVPLDEQCLSRGRDLEDELVP